MFENICVDQDRIRSGVIGPIDDILGDKVIEKMKRCNRKELESGSLKSMETRDKKMKYFVLYRP